MSKEKEIVRTIITGYKYEVMTRKGDTLTKVGELITEKAIRSIKQQKDELTKNNLDVNSVLVPVGTIDKKYSISEDEFLKYAKEVI